jgi:ABC-type microcin C transport system permease subunit YejB
MSYNLNVDKVELRNKICNMQSTTKEIIDCHTESAKILSDTAMDGFLIAIILIIIFLAGCFIGKFS